AGATSLLLHLIWWLAYGDPRSSLTENERLHDHGSHHPPVRCQLHARYACKLHTSEGALMERIKIEITEAEARVILMAISQILDANARDLDELKLAGFSVREVRAMERVENKIARAKQKGPGEWLAPGS